MIKIGIREIGGTRIMKDTLPEMEKIQIELLRKIPPGRKGKIILEFIELQRKLLIEGIKARHPEYSEKEILYAFKRLILGDELYEKVFPEDKNVKP